MKPYTTYVAYILKQYFTQRKPEQSVYAANWDACNIVLMRYDKQDYDVFKTIYSSNLPVKDIITKIAGKKECKFWHMVKTLEKEVAIERGLYDPTRT